MLSDDYIDIRTVANGSAVVAMSAASAGGRAHVRNSRHVPVRSA